MRTNIRVFAALAAMIAATGMAEATTGFPSRLTLVADVTSYLADHGDLCVGKYTWPRYVTEADRRDGSNDAVQLPVLQRLGLVESTTVTPAGAAVKVHATNARQPGAAEPVERYSLTGKGREYYLHKTRVVLGAHGHPVSRDADLCVARLSLDRVVKWSPPERVNGHVETIVWYTYHIKAAKWMADPQARSVFPVVDRIIRGQGSLLMSVTVQLRDGKWVAVLPGE